VNTFDVGILGEQYLNTTLCCFQSPDLQVFNQRALPLILGNERPDLVLCDCGNINGHIDQILDEDGCD
jgi:hypothetical protein